MCHQGVVQFDGHLLDHGVQEIIHWNDFLVCDIRSVGFGDLELEFHVTLGQVDVVGGGFNVEIRWDCHVGFLIRGNKVAIWRLKSTCPWEGFETIPKPNFHRGTMRNTWGLVLIP